MNLGAARLHGVIEATWPAAACREVGPWCLRDGAGGGKRVSAATATGPVTMADLRQAETLMRAMGQPALFMIRQGDGALDALLDAAGYDVIDPVNLYAAPLHTIATQPPPRVSMFPIWEPLHIQRDIWRRSGIDAARLAVMERAACPHTSIFARWDEHPAGTGFVGVQDGIAMVHAVEILPAQRRKGVGTWLMRAAAFWAQEQGAAHLSVACARTNAAANGLYSSLGMTLVGQYHYRIAKDPPA